jgi:hypothetical protein
MNRLFARLLFLPLAALVCLPLLAARPRTASAGTAAPICTNGNCALVLPGGSGAPAPGCGSAAVLAGGCPAPSSNGVLILPSSSGATVSGALPPVANNPSPPMTAAPNPSATPTVQAVVPITACGAGGGCANAETQNCDGAQIPLGQACIPSEAGFVSCPDGTAIGPSQACPTSNFENCAGTLVQIGYECGSGIIVNAPGGSPIAGSPAGTPGSGTAGGSLPATTLAPSAGP